MNQYIQKQRNHFSCGPIAILNALKWRDKKASYNSHYKKLVEQCNTTKEGTSDADLERVLRKYKFKFARSRLFKRIQNHLENGGALILAHLDSDNEWHYSFWYEYRFGKFYGANIDYSTEVVNVTEYSMRKYLLKSAEAQAWLL